MTKRVLDIRDMAGEEDSIASDIGLRYQTWKSARDTWEVEKGEIRQYLFATDTTKTSNSTLPWKNTTTLPKLTQIRDNLHANYMAALFPHRDWLKWLPETQEAADAGKARAIEVYMANKIRQSGFQTTVSQLVLDYIDYGNAFGEVVFHSEYTTNEEGVRLPVYIGPKLQRISPFDITFDYSAASFGDTPTITRTIMTMGALRKKMNTETGVGWIEEAFTKSSRIRVEAMNMGTEDTVKMEGWVVDGFSSPEVYFTSGRVELLEFEGDWYDAINDKLYENRRIIIMDRMFVLLNETYESWLGRSNKEHVGWRQRPDNIMAMGPLDNLVGMQYRMDHLENLRADVFDQIALPMVYQRGYVEDWEWEPNGRIYGDPESDVQVFRPDATALGADFQIGNLQAQMEEMAGAPRQAMGIRTPGEKTAFEVQSLDNAAGRIFQNKVSYFEENFLEPLLNQMLEAARRNMDVADQIRVQDDDFGVAEFLSVKPEDIKATGKLVPIGARHFARQNQVAQNLLNLTSSQVYADPAVNVHMSGKAIAKLMEEMLDLERFELVRENIRIEENAESTALQQTAAVSLNDQAATGPEVAVNGPAETGPPITG